MVPTPFRYPLRGNRAIDVLLVGGALHLVSVYVPVAPLIVVLGYLVVVLGETTTRDPVDRFEALPSVPGFVDLVRTGFGGAVVVGVFLAPAAIVLLVTVAGLTRVPFSSASVTMERSVGFLAGSTASLTLAVAFLYVIPVGLLRYGITGRIRAAFDTGAVRTAVRDGAYFYNVLVGAVVGALGLILGAITTQYVVGFVIAFYAEIVAVAFWSRGLGRVLATIPPDERR